MTILLHHQPCFAFKKSPFDTGDIEFFFTSNQHQEALMRLGYFLRNPVNSISLLIGEIGCGKTMIAKTLHNVLCKKFDCYSVYISNCFETLQDIICEVLFSIGKGKISRAKLHSSLKNCNDYHLLAYFDHIFTSSPILKGKKLLLILDEAQDLSPHGMNIIKKISNFAVDRKYGLLILLCGQDDLLDVISEQQSIEQRIDISYHLKKLNEDQTARYIDFRLKRAGHQGKELFCSESKKIIYEYAKGVPREINRICRLSLEFGLTRNLDTIPLSLVRSVISDHNGQKIRTTS